MAPARFGFYYVGALAGFVHYFPARSRAEADALARIAAKHAPGRVWIEGDNSASRRGVPPERSARETPATSAVVPLEVSRQHAVLVGALIEARVAPLAERLKGTALAPLPEFGRRLRDAARRQGRPGAQITLWEVPRAEAEAGFHYLCLFRHPDVPEDFLTAEEAPAVHGIALALGAAIGAKRGRKRLTREEAEGLIRAAAIDAKRGRKRLTREEAELLETELSIHAAQDQRPGGVDPSFARKLKRRLKDQDVLGRTPLNEIPVMLLLLLAPSKISR